MLPLLPSFVTRILVITIVSLTLLILNYSQYIFSFSIKNETFLKGAMVKGGIDTQPPRVAV
jgi:hypothetical protein